MSICFLVLHIKLLWLLNIHLLLYHYIKEGNLESWRPSDGHTNPSQLLVRYWSEWKNTWQQGRRSPHNQYPLLWKPLCHEARLVLLHAFVCCMLYFVDPFVSNHSFSLFPRHNLPHLGFHDGVILLNHSLLPHIMLCNLLEIGRLGVNQLCHQFHKAKSIWWFAPPHGALWKSCLPRILNCGPKPLTSWPSVYLLLLLDILLLLWLIL